MRLLGSAVVAVLAATFLLSMSSVAVAAVPPGQIVTVRGATAQSTTARFPVVKGAGSAFFLHVTNGRPTAGCVALSAAHLDAIMRRLQPSLHPVISIGVGAQATAFISQNNAAVARHNPVGHLDAATPIGSRRVAISGWAMDPDNRAAVLRVHLYVDARSFFARTTGVARPDVARIMRAGPDQGYATVVALSAGPHTICAYVFNIGTGTRNPQLGCKTVIVR